VVPATASKINSEMSFVPVSRAGERRWIKVAKLSALEVVSAGPKRRASDRPSNSRRIRRFLHGLLAQPRARTDRCQRASLAGDALVALLLGGGSARALDSSRLARFMTPPSRSRARHLLDLAIPFVGVGAGAVTVVLFHNPKDLIPRPPYWPWLFTVGALGAFAMVLALGLDDGWEEDDQVDHAERWRAAVLAYVAGLVASVTFVVMVTLLDRLD